MNAHLRSAAAATVVLVLAVVLSACGPTMSSVPIPGTGVGGDTMKLEADFGDALNLAQGAPVKVNGVDAGKVSDVGEKNFVAEVTMTVRKKAELRQGATARLRYTTPLGELFVDVDNPRQGPLLRDGAKLGLAATSTAPTVEDALSEASLLINGGGLDQLQTVAQELNTALGGHEGDYRALIDKAKVFLTEANSTTGSIDQVLNSLNALSKTLNARKGTINRAVREIRPAARVLRQETPGFTKLLKELDKFSGAANATVDATRAQLLRMLKQIQPVLAEFARNRNSWGPSLRSLVAAGNAADGVVANDYLNLSLNLHLDSSLLSNLPALLNLLGLGDLLNGLTGNALNGVLSTLGNLLGGATGGLLGGLTGSQKTTKTATTKGGTTKGGTAPQPTGGISGLLGALLGGGR